MSDILINPLYGDGGLATNANPRMFTGSFSTEEMSLCYIIVTVTSVSGGVNAGNPATITWQTSIDHGATWRALDGIVVEPITAAGIFTARLTGDTTIVGPSCRVVVTPPAGETVVIEKVEKSKITDLAVFRSTAAGGGGGGGVTGTIVGVGGAAQYVSGAALSGQTVASYMIGYDGATHREMALSPTGGLITSTAPKNIIETDRIDYTLTPVTKLAWTEVVASTSAGIEWMDIFDSSGETLQIGTGAAGSEVHLGYVIPGGNSLYNIIPVGTRIALRAVSNDAAIGEFVVNMFG